MAIRSAAARHFASFGKSRNDVAVATPPFDVPLTRNITRTRVHTFYSFSIVDFVARFFLASAVWAVPINGIQVDALAHRPDSTFGAVNDDALAFKNPKFERADFCKIILNSAWDARA
jgi:hypothetical protein